MLKKFIFVIIIPIIINGQQDDFLEARRHRKRPQPAQKLTLAEWPSYNIIEPDGPGTYAYGYEIADPASGNVQFKDEERLRNGTVQGSYGLLQPDGSISVTKYIADEGGYRQKTETRRDPTLVNNYQPAFTTTKRPKRPHRRPPRPGQIEQVTISPEVASQIVQQHQNIIPITESSLITTNNGEPVIINNHPTRIIGVRPQLPIGSTSTTVRPPIYPQQNFNAITNDVFGIDPNQLKYPTINPLGLQTTRPTTVQPIFQSQNPFRYPTINPLHQQTTGPTTFAPPIQYPSSSPQPIPFEHQHFNSDRFYSPFNNADDYDYPQPIYDIDQQQNSFFQQNSKLHKFFQSPFYLNDILPGTRMIDPNYQNPNNRPPVIDQQNSINPFTREANWFKQFINNQRIGGSAPQFLNQVPADYVDHF